MISLRGESLGREAAERCEGDGTGEVCSSVEILQGEFFMRIDKVITDKMDSVQT